MYFLYLYKCKHIVVFSSIQIHGLGTYAGIILPVLECAVLEEVGAFTLDGDEIENLMVDSPDGCVRFDYNLTCLTVAMKMCMDLTIVTGAARGCSLRKDQGISSTLSAFSFVHFLDTFLHLVMVILDQSA